MSYALFVLVLLIVSGFVWALVATSMTVTYVAISCLSLAAIGILLAVSGPHSHK